MKQHLTHLDCAYYNWESGSLMTSNLQKGCCYPWSMHRSRTSVSLQSHKASNWHLLAADVKTTTLVQSYWMYLQQLNLQFMQTNEYVVESWLLVGFGKEMLSLHKHVRFVAFVSFLCMVVLVSWNVLLNNLYLNQVCHRMDSWYWSLEMQWIHFTESWSISSFSETRNI